MGVVWYTDVLMTFLIVMGPMVLIGSVYEPQLNDGTWSDHRLELMAGSGMVTVGFAYLLYLAWMKESGPRNNASRATNENEPSGKNTEG